jgi:hypothetical protein
MFPIVWLAKRPSVNVHFTPTYGSWLNLVARWFVELTNKQLRRAYTAVSPSWRPPFASSLMRIMRIRSRSSGPRPPIRFSRGSLALPNGHTRLSRRATFARTTRSGH